MKYFAAKLLRATLGLSSGVAAFATMLSSHPVFAAAAELFPADFDQKIALVSTDPRIIAARVINAILMISGVIMVGLVLYGGYTYMTAAGEEEKVSRAKKILTSAVIGLAIILSSMAITRFVLSSILGSVSTGDACTNVGVTEGCAVGYCSGTRTCAPGGFYGSCVQINSSCVSGLESVPRGTFSVVSISPNTTINSKKIVVKVVLSDIPKSETVAGSIVIKNKTTGAVIPGTVYQGAITFARGTANEKVLPLASDTIAFVPQTLCPGLEARDLHCFDASTAYSVEVLPSLARATDSTAVYCGLSGDKCRASFTSGTEVDLTAPTVAMRIDPTSMSTTECATVQADVSDDGGISEVEFWHSAVNARNATSTDKFSVLGGQGSVGRLMSARWCPTATSSVDEKHFLYVRAFDNDTGMTETSRQEIRLRPGSCVVAGPGCGNGEGGSCTTTADCFNGLTCDATTHTCQAKPRITLVSLGNGRPGTMVTVWGMYFGVTPGRIEFTGPNGTRLAADVPRNCGASFKSWDVDTRTSAATVTVLVPTGAVDGPVYVTTAAGLTDASNDTNGVLTPANMPGPGVPPAGEYDVNDINRPGACSIDPLGALWGARFTIATVEAGSSTGAVVVNDTPTPQISSWSNSSVGASVPRTDYSTPAAPALVSVIASNGVESNQLRFSVNSPDAGTVPEIIAIDPSASGGPSTGLTIRGKNFGSAPGVVYFASPDGQVVKADLSDLPESCGGNYWNATQIRVKVPRVLDKDDWNANGNRSEVLEDKKYKVYVVRYDAVESNRPDFAMTGRAEARPFIWCISPESGKSFTNVTVYGEQLGAAPSAANRGLMFNTLASGASTPTAVVATLTNVGGTPGSPCPNNGWDDHTVCAQVPANAVSGKVRIETKCGDVDCISNEVDFNIGSCSDPKTPLTCRGAEQCCADGICRANGTCQASIPNGFYGWTFTTASTPVSPHVVEDCAENALDAGVDTATLAGRYASPAPWATRAGGDAVCANAAITVRFAPSVVEGSLNTNRVVVEQCGAGTAKPTVKMGFEQGASEGLPQIVKPEALSVSLLSLPGSAAEGTGVLKVSKLVPTPNRAVGRCSDDLSMGCTSAAQCAASGATCKIDAGDANVFVDDFAAKVAFPNGSEVRGRTYVATIKVRAAQGAVADPTRRAGILIRKNNADGTREEVRTTSLPLSDTWQDISARLTMSDKVGTAEVRIFLLSPDSATRNAESDFYTYGALFDSFTISDIAGVDCASSIPVNLESIPSNHGFCTGDYKTVCTSADDCKATVGGDCVKATDGFRLTPSNTSHTFVSSVCDKGDALKIGKSCTDNASCGAGGICRDGVWYRVVLKSGVCSNNAAKTCVTKADCGTATTVACNGITAFADSGAAMKENPGMCGSGNAYCFLFRIINKTCAVGAVITAPNPWIAKSEGEAIPYTAVPVAANDACINLNPSGLNWQWTSSDTTRAGIDGNTTAANAGQSCRTDADCAIAKDGEAHSCIDSHCTGMPWTATAVALNETEVLPKVQPVKISATVESGDKSKVTGPADLFIQFAEPAVTEVWPRCAAACLNAEIGAHFNIPMDKDTLLASGNIQLWRVNCGNGHIDGGEDCDDGNTVAGDGCSNVCKNEGSNFTFNCGNGILNAGEDCDDHNAIAGDGCSASCLREPVLTGLWALEQKNGTAKLLGEKDAETGWTVLVKGVCGDGTLDQKEVSGGTIGESCDDKNAVSGDGCSATCALEGTTVTGAICGNAKLERGEECEKGTDGRFASWCNAATCVRLGTTSPVCGNGKIDPGEECEKSSLVGAAQALCNASCLWTGTLSYSPPVRLAGCGNTKVEVGESCDDGNAKSGDGCSATCLNEGSTTTTGPGCGNGHIDKGESCDSADPATTNGCDPNRCVHIGTKHAECGNGILETGESCDWKVMVNARPPGTEEVVAEAQAKATCKTEATALSPEVCVNLGPIAPTCGNGRVDIGESCDDSNVDSGDGCSSKCLNEGTLSATVPISVRLANDNNTEVIIEPQNNALLSANSTYRAILMGEDYCIGTNCTPGLQSASHKPLTALNFWRSNTATTRNSAPPGILDSRQNPNAYSWTFTTGTELCTPDRVDVTPADSSLYMIGARSRLDVKARAKPDSCDAEGQVLNALLYGWTWKSDKVGVATVVTPQDRIPQCGDAMVERGEDCDDGNAMSLDGCSDRCVNEGSKYARQCGNGIIDAGESCDDKNTISGDGCSSKCLIEGFVPGPWKIGTREGICGNHILEHAANATTGNPGEECDDGNLIKNDGCSPLCIKEGSRAPLCNDDNNRRLDTDPISGSGEACDPKAGSALGCDPNRCVWTGTASASCGNKRVEHGEDCDDGNVKSGDGCSEICLHEGVSANWAVTISTENEIRVIANSTPQAGFRIISRGICGNSVVEQYTLPGTGGAVGEECDDGNTTSGDGCSARCANEGTARVTITDNAGGDPTQYVEAKGITVEQFCHRADQDFPETGRIACTNDRRCNQADVVGASYTGVPWVCDAFNPWATATIEAKINAWPSRQDGAKDKAGTAQVTVYCGAKSDAQCAEVAHASTGSVGVGADSCCYERPTPDANLTEPTITQGVCPNGIFAIGFNQVIDEDSLAGNVLLARRVDTATCPAGSTPVDALGHLQSSVRNSSFEQNTSDNVFNGWAVTKNDKVEGSVVPTAEPAANTGEWAARMELTNTNEADGITLSTPISVTAGTRYRATVWYQVIKSNKKEDAAFIRVRGENGFLAQYAVPKDAAVGEWKSVYLSFVPTTQSKYTLELALDKVAVILWDDVSLETIGSAHASADSLFGRAIAWVKSVFAADEVHADAGLWCVSTGADATVEPQADGVSSLVRVAPKKVLDTKAQYKLIARGDSSLGDGVVDGITNFRGVAMNGETVHQWMFTTAEKLCTLDDVRLDLSCVRNGKCENNTRLSCNTDRDCGPVSDANAICNGEAFSGDECAAFRKKDQTTRVRAAALSNAAGGQEIQPIDGYRWAWNFNTSAVDIVSISKNSANPSAPVQRLGGAAGGRACTPTDNKTLTCQDGHCGGSTYLPECHADVDCASLATCKNGYCGGLTSLSKCSANADCSSYAISVCKSAIDILQEAKSGAKRGEAFVSAEAKITEDSLNPGLTTNLGQTQVGTQRFISTLCENPWPSDTTRRCTTNPSKICTINDECGEGKCVASLPLNDPEYSETAGPLGGDRPTNFSLWYCRDATPLLPAPIAVGLPELSTLSAASASSTMARALFRDGAVGGVGIAASTSRAEILKEVILTLATTAGSSNDAIGIRILRNDARLAPMEWYQSQGFVGKPVALTDMVDGYQAIQDGRTIYIGGTNLVSGSEPRIYSNIYVLAYNEGASDTTKAVYREILKNFRLNINLDNARVCSRDITKSCSEDAECTGAGTCLSDIDKLHRDIIRVNDFSRMSAALESTRTRTGTYPLISSGSYLRAMSVSAWPSWQGALGSSLGIALPNDPLKTGLGRCLGDDSPCVAMKRCSLRPTVVCLTNTDCSGGAGQCDSVKRCQNNDSKTCEKDADCIAPGVIAGACFNQTTGVYACPAGSHVYQYQAIGSQAYKLSANFEYTPNSYAPYPALWGLNSANFDISYCHASNAIEMFSNVLRCGDGVVGTDTAGTCASDANCTVPGSHCVAGHCAEECEPGQVDRQACPLTLASASNGTVTFAATDSDGKVVPVIVTSTSRSGSVCVSDVTRSCSSSDDCQSSGYLGTNDCIPAAKLSNRVCKNYATQSCVGDDSICIAEKDMGSCVALAPAVVTIARGASVCVADVTRSCTTSNDCPSSGYARTNDCVSVSTLIAPDALSSRVCQNYVLQNCEQSDSLCVADKDMGLCTTITTTARRRSVASTSPIQLLGTQTRTCNSSCSYGTGGGWSPCRLDAYCGDNKVDAGEVCDNGNLNGTYGKCNTSCSGMGSYCGDGTRDAGEVCDKGNLNGVYALNAADSCKDDCSGSFASCGDGTVQKTDGEVCDRPGSSVPDSRGVCGTGSSAGRLNSACITDADCGGTANTCNLCPATATYQQVKKGTCGTDCRSIAWKTVSDTDSTLKCFAQGQCGNGVKEGTEVCDDGNSTNTDGCIIDAGANIMCQLAKCGDGFVMGKVCAGDTPGQERKCTDETVEADCGTGGRCVVKEECDQGAGNGLACTPRSGSDCTYCSNSCRRITVSGDYCGDGKWNSAVEECDKNLNPQVNAWEGLILKNSSNVETERYICIGTPGINQNAWSFADSSSWGAVDQSRLSVRNMVEQTTGGSFGNNIFEVKPVTASVPDSDLNLYSVQTAAINGGATSRMFQISLLARCGRGAGSSCGGIGVDFVKENFTPTTPFKCDPLLNNCINVPLQSRAVSGSQWVKFTKTLSVPPGIQNYRLRVYFAQTSGVEPVWIDSVAVVPVSTTPAPSPWSTATILDPQTNQQVPVVGVGTNNVAMCNAQTCGRGCPTGGVVCENKLFYTQNPCSGNGCNNVKADNDRDNDKIADACDADRDGDGVLDVNDCNSDDKTLNSDSGMILSYGDNNNFPTWDIKVGPEVRALHFFVADYNVNGDPEESPLTMPKHDLTKLSDATWLRQENDRLRGELRGKNVCVRSSDNAYSTQICSSSSECNKHVGVTESCKPWDDSKWVDMPRHDGFFKFKFSLNPTGASAGTTFGNDGTPITDDSGAAIPQARAVGLGSPEEVTIHLPEATTDRVVRMRWINDWCHRGSNYGCMAPADGIGHDLNLVIQRILVDTETAAGRCEKLEAPNGSTVWPVGTIAAPVILSSSPYTPSSGGGAVIATWPADKIGTSCDVSQNNDNGFAWKTYAPDTCGDNGEHRVGFETQYLACLNNRCAKCTDNVQCEPTQNSLQTHQNNNVVDRWRCDTSSGLCVVSY